MLKAPHRDRNPLGIFYRVSILDENINKWVVKHAGKTKFQAEAIVAEYFDKGIMARLSAC